LFVIVIILNNQIKNNDKVAKARRTFANLTKKDVKCWW